MNMTLTSKLKHAKKFLTDSAKLQSICLFLKVVHLFKDKGEILLLRFAQELEEYVVVEQLPKLEGKE